MVVLPLLIFDALVMGAAWLLRGHLPPAWQKGPLIDAAAPYAADNAVLLLALAACVASNVYLLLLARWRRRAWVALFLGMGAAEVALRAVLWDTQVTYFRPHPTLHWQVRPNLRDFPNLGAPGTTITTDEHGMRVAPAGSTRILVLGDSSNFGHGVQDDETWAARLGARNGACPGWTTVQAVEFLEETGLSLDPDWVLAGFNNDPGPEYLGDAARRSPPWVRRANAVLFRLETWLVAREVILALARGAPDPDVALVPRVPLADFVANLERLDELTRSVGARFAWIDMPINRAEPARVSRYVDPAYREAAQASGLTLIDVDDRWERTREPDLHVVGHVFHPSAKGHLRMAQQIAHELGLSADGIDGPPPAATEATLRFGYSTLTPVHGHVGAVLEAKPELAAEHGIALELHGYADGQGQGADVASGALDAFLTSGVSAVAMLVGRADQRIVASLGDLGRVALVGSASPSRVGVAPGSTGERFWRSLRIDAEEVALPVSGIDAAIAAGTIDAGVVWDPWIRGEVVAEEALRSLLSVSVPWAMGAPGRCRALVDLVEHALRVAAADRPRWDAVVAERSGLPVDVVRPVADRNAILGGRGGEVALATIDREQLLATLVAAPVPGLTIETLTAPSMIDDLRPLPRVTFQ